MPKFAANLSMMFTEHAFLDRFDAAAEAGFAAVEFLFPYDHPPEAIAERLERNRLTQALFNLPPGRWDEGERGLAALPARFDEFKSGLKRALDYVAATKVKRVHMMAGNASRKLGDTIAALNPVLRGWTSYFRLTEVKGVLQDLDGWIRRKLRCLLWRQWKRPATRNRKLQARGLDSTRAWKSASNGRGPWWNAGASHMNAAYPKSFFDASGLVSLLDTQRRFQCV